MTVGTPVWLNPSQSGNYDIVIDVDGDGYYYADKDFLDTTLEVSIPTLISLLSFDAISSYRSITIMGTTASEIDNASFNLYRSESEDGEYVKINGVLIPAEGSPTQGATYQFIDENVKNRTTYYYKLEDVDLNGTSTMHGPVSVTPRAIYSLER